MMKKVYLAYGFTMGALEQWVNMAFPGTYSVKHIPNGLNVWMISYFEKEYYVEVAKSPFDNVYNVYYYETEEEEEMPAEDDIVSRLKKLEKFLRES